MYKSLVPLRTISTVMSVCALGFLLATAAHAQVPRLTDLVISDSKDGPDMNVFKPVTPKIYVTASLKDVPVGTKITSRWIAEQIRVVLPNFEIDSVDTVIGPSMNWASFALAKPTIGWPTGEYRVELLIEGKLAETVRFKVAL